MIKEYILLVLGIITFVAAVLLAILFINLTHDYISNLSFNRDMKKIERCISLKLTYNKEKNTCQ